MSFGEKWIELKIIMLSEIIQTEKQTSCFSFRHNLEFFKDMKSVGAREGYGGEYGQSS
jgi:hypothetical protein